MPDGPSEQAVPRNNAQPTLGVGFYLRLDLARVCLCGIRHRYLRQQDRRLEGLQIAVVHVES